jgi:hypothetical protein
VPFDVAFSLSVTERQEWVVAMGQLEGRIFDWATASWAER